MVVGTPTPMVVHSLVEQFNALPGRTFRAISYPFRGGWKDNLHKTVCVVEAGDDLAVEYRQGSGFLAPNGFILTNSHNIVINGVMAPSIIVRFPDHLGVDIEVDTDDIVNVQQNGSLYLADLSAIIAPFIH
jgi:hypothetical protein